MSKNTPPRVEIRSNKAEKALRGRPTVVIEKKPKPEVPVRKPPAVSNVVKKSGGIKENNKPAVCAVPENVGMIFFVPKPPLGLQREFSELILQSKFHEALLKFRRHPIGNFNKPEKILIDFLISVGSAVPIPKALIANPLKERLNAPQNKKLSQILGGGGNSASVMRDVIGASIATWLWAEHKDCFHQAVTKSGRINVDPDCKWLIHISIEKSIFTLATSLCDDGVAEVRGVSSHLPESRVAAIVTEALSDHIVVDDRMDTALPVVGKLVNLLDDLRVDALRAKAQERALLASLVSRRGNMSESFSHAYVSALVRAGEALGHEDVCEVVQDETCRTSTMLPYDFFSDSAGVWEEPNRPSSGFFPGITGDELKKRAHARSTIQKSIKKLQDRIGIKGGIFDGGPYMPSSPTSSSGLTPIPSETPPGTVQPSLKRKSPHGLEAKPTRGNGTKAISETIFFPGHVSSPLLWNVDDIGNSPYGGQKDLYRASAGGHASSKKGSHGTKAAIQVRCTHEIEWTEVASMFDDGGAARGSPSNKRDDTTIQQLSQRTNIFAPFVHSFDQSSLAFENDSDDDGSSSDEDISDETMLARHQDVLNEMKEKIDVALEERQQQKLPRNK